MEKKEVLQAVVMADNYSECFKPFTTFSSPVILITPKIYQVFLKSLLLNLRLSYHWSMFQ
jgi:hypothetical protein